MQLIIHPHELTPRWLELARKLKLERVSLHPVGGKQAHENLRNFLEILNEPSFRAKIDELWENGVQVDTPFDGLMAFSDATELWGLNESTLRKAITYGKLVNGVDVCKFGKQWVVSVDAMKREYGNGHERV